MRHTRHTSASASSICFKSLPLKVKFFIQQFFESEKKGITVWQNFSVARSPTATLFWFLFRLFFLFLFGFFLGWRHAGYYDVIIFGIWRWFTGEEFEAVGIFNLWRQCRANFFRMIDVEPIIVLNYVMIRHKAQNYPFIGVFLGF